MNKTYESLSISNPHPPFTDKIQQMAVGLSAMGLVGLLLALFGIQVANSGLILSIALTLISIGIVIYGYRAYMTKLPGIKNDGIWFSGIASRGMLGWITGIMLTGFYVLLYWYPQYLGLNAEGNKGIIALFDPLSQLLKGKPASEWFLYGTLYTVAILMFGIRFLFKYRHNRYQIFRTISVMFFQLGFAFLLPELLQGLNYPYHDFKNIWPLNYYFFYDWNIKNFLSSGNVGMLMLVSGILMILVVSPILTYLYGKRWYCSWVCGCGGLAETAGDPFRQLSDKSLKAWQLERWIIHSVLVIVVFMTLMVLYGYFSMESTLWGISIYIIQSLYGFWIGAAFSGVVGVGFYPILGSRVWCRFGCPMAAILGMQQKFFSRFRITTNGGQCISCGNCSTYCEMGIDVRSYAQKGQNIVRSSCVGCGICAAVCPRGVLKLENGSADISSRTDLLKAIHISENEITLLS